MYDHIMSDAILSPSAMRDKLVYAYQQVLLGMQTGKSVVVVKWSDESVTYEAKTTVLNQLKTAIAGYHAICPSVDSAAVLGLGQTRPIGVHFGR